MPAYTTNGIVLPKFRGDEDPNAFNWGAIDKMISGTHSTTRLVTASAAVIKPQASATPAVNGDMVFELTSNTTLNIKVKGSDGTVRSVSLTLA